MSKKFVVIMIFVLLVMNGAVLYLILNKVKVSADSASQASQNIDSFSFSNFDSSLGKIPDKDVVGSDFEGVARYKDSVRTKYIETEKSINIEYQVKEPANLVLNYYKTLLAKSDWVVASYSSGKIEFSKDNKLISVETTSSNSVTTIKIELIK